MLSRFLTLLLLFFASVAGAQTPAGSVAGRDARVWSADPDDYARIDPETWHAVRLVLPWESGAVTEIDLLRPRAWVALHDAHPGSEIFVDAGELGVRGYATVVSVERCPPLAELAEGHRHVIGKFVTTDAEVLDLVIEGLGGPVGITATHPLWSEDRAVWVRAGDLEAGERLRTAGGSASVVSVTPRPERETVYNLQLHRHHTFYVTDAKLWAHNCDFDTFDNLQDAIGITGINGITIVGEAATKSQGMIAQGFTRVVYAIDDIGQQWTTFFNPTTKRYGNAHLSSSNPF
ncbi:MAG: polymorphic toxin-type HINT domain-containing protein [Planctomycetota bacterium]